MYVQARLVVPEPLVSKYSLLPFPLKLRNICVYFSFLPVGVQILMLHISYQFYIVNRLIYAKEETNGELKGEYNFSLNIDEETSNFIYKKLVRGNTMFSISMWRKCKILCKNIWNPSLTPPDIDRSLNFANLDQLWLTKIRQHVWFENFLVCSLSPLFITFWLKNSWRLHQRYSNTWGLLVSIKIAWKAGCT